MKISPAYSFTKEHIENEFSAFNSKKVVPWSFFRNENGFEITALDGSKIRYKGVEFEGSPRTVFWEYFPQPFLKDIISRTFKMTRGFCHEHDLDAVIPLKETALLLVDHVTNTFKMMDEIDRRLRGKGYPKSVSSYDFSNEYKNITAFINERFEAELYLLPKKNVLNRFYEKQKFWVWFVGIVFSLAGIIIKIFG